MKEYIKPEMEIIALRLEERISNCANSRLKTENDWRNPADCNLTLPVENLWSADCYDITDCS